VKRLKLSTVAGLLLAVGLLTGCALLMDEPTEQAQELEESSDSKWLIASQGEEEPEACEEELSRNEARREAKEALKEEDEAQLLEQTLAALGKRLYVWRAKGCEVETEDGSGAEAQGLRALAEEEETILVEVPAGRDAALYLVESGDEGNYWVSLKEEAEGGERLVHIEVGLDGDAQGLSAHTEVSFFLPNDEVTQGIAKQVHELLEGSGAEGAGLRAMSAEELDWSRAEVILLDGYVEDGEEAEALLVVPYVGAEGQSLWGSRRAAIEVERALYARVKVRREAAEGGRPSYRVSGQAPVVRKGSELERAFRFCPYQYYGRLSPFRRALCQGSWQRWYYKQWQTGSIYDKWAALYNQAAELASANGGVPSMFLKGYNLLLYGFEHLEGDWIREMVALAQQYPWQPAGGSSPLPPPPQEIIQALSELVEALDDPDFAQRVEEVEGKYPLFAGMLADMALLAQRDKVSLARDLAELAQEDERGAELWLRFYWIKQELIARGIIAVPEKHQELPMECCSPLWRNAVLSALVEKLIFDPDLRDIEIERELALDLLDNFFTALERFLAGEHVYPGVDADQLIADLLNLIPGAVLERVWGWPPIKPFSPKAKAIREYLRLMQLLGNMVVKGKEQGTIWQFIEIGHNLGGGKRIDLIATADIPGLGQVTTFSRAYDQLPDNANEIQAIIDFAARHAAEYPGRDVVFIFVGGETTDDAVDERLGDITATVPVVIVYCKSGCDGPNPEYGIKWKGNITEEEAYQIACSKGFDQFCEGPPKPPPPPPPGGWPQPFVWTPPPPPPPCLTCSPQFI